MGHVRSRIDPAIEVEVEDLSFITSCALSL